MSEQPPQPQPNIELLNYKIDQLSKEVAEIKLDTKANKETAVEIKAEIREFKASAKTAGFLGGLFSSLIVFVIDLFWKKP